MKDARAVVTVLAGATLLGSLGAWGRAVYRFEPDPIVVVTWRALIGAAALAALLAAFRPDLLRVRRRDLPFFLVYGLVGVTLNFWMYFSAVKHTSLAVAITLLYTYPVFVALLSAAFFGERIGAAKAGAIGLTLLGSGLVAQAYETRLLRLNLTGIVYGLLTGLSMAAYSLLGKRALGRYAPWTVVLYAFAAGSVFLAIGSGAKLLAAARYPGIAWVWIFALALVPSVGGYALYTLGLRDLSASRASVVATWEVVTAAALGWLLFAEQLAGPQILGAALVCLGIAWVQRPEA